MPPIVWGHGQGWVRICFLITLSLMCLPGAHLVSGREKEGGERLLADTRGKAVVYFNGRSSNPAPSRLGREGVPCKPADKPLIPHNSLGINGSLLRFFWQKPHCIPLCPFLGKPPLNRSPHLISPLQPQLRSFGGDCYPLST